MRWEQQEMVIDCINHGYNPFRFINLGKTASHYLSISISLSTQLNLLYIQQVVIAIEQMRAYICSSARRRQPKPRNEFPFEGETDIAKIKFNSANTITLWTAIAAKQRKRLNLLEHYPELKQYCSGAALKSVCSKLVGGGEMVVECYDCRVDQSCIICYECYKNGTHQGHKIIFKKSAEGCCDCGDAQAWNPAGFCRNHTGQLADTFIEETVISQFCGIMQDVFYLYYRLKLKQQHNAEGFSSALFDLMMVLIESGIKGIKLLSIFFANSPSPTHVVNQQLQKQPFLHHFLIYKLMKDEIRQWERIFINMFPYYAFKKQLMAAYMACFVQIYAGDRAADSGQSLSCQLLTSYKLVDDYIASAGSLPLGFNVHLNVEACEEMGLWMMLADLQRINSLQGEIPLKYWRFHISYGIDSIFSHYELIKVKYSKSPANKIKTGPDTEFKEQGLEAESREDKLTSFLIKKVDLIQYEVKLLKMMNQTIRFIKKDKQLLMLLITKIYGLIVANLADQFVIFRPYDRLFALALFHLIDGDFSLLSNPQFRQNLQRELGVELQQWNRVIVQMGERMLWTYSFFSHILTNENKGYNSSFYDYLYYYQLNDRFIASIDVVHLKMMALICDRPFVVVFDDVFRIKELAPPQWNLKRLSEVMQEIGLLYTSKISQICLAHETSEGHRVQGDEYKQQILSYLCKFITSQGGSAGIDKIMQFSSTFLLSKKETLKRYLQAISRYDKERKVFVLNEQAKDTDGFNYRDFQLRTKITNYSRCNQNPKFTQQFIQDYNRDVFLRIWNQQNVQSVKAIILATYQRLQTNQERQNIVDLIALVCKFIHLLSKAGADTQANSVQYLLGRMTITASMKREVQFYDALLNQSVVGGEQQSAQKISKKEMLLAKKKKKMEEIKRTQSQNMNLAKIIHEEELQKINNQDQQQGDSQCCAVCRNREKSLNQIVYLVDMKIRDVEKLLGLGRGVKTLSFTTCYHVYHYSCLVNSEISALDYRRTFHCPLCRTSGNVFFPVDPITSNEQSKQFLLGCLKRIGKISATVHGYESAEAVQQLVKSFYHYVMIGQYDLDYLKGKRRKLYQVIMRLLSNVFFKEKIELLQEKLKKSTINIRPKKTAVRQCHLANIFANHLELLQDPQNDSEMEIQQLPMVGFMGMEDRRALRSNGNARNEPGKKSKRILKKTKVLKTTDVFRYVLQRIIVYLESKITAQLKAERVKIVGEEEQNNQIEFQDQEADWTWPKVAPAIEAIVDNLLNQENIASQIGNCPQIIFESLPEVYCWDMSKNTCDSCKEIGMETMKCLMCAWKGCSRCKSGSINKHIDKMHGQICPFMRIDNANCYLMSQGQTMLVGCLYANEWGEKFNITKEWKDYFLQKDVFAKMKQTLLRDE